MNVIFKKSIVAFVCLSIFMACFQFITIKNVQASELTEVIISGSGTKDDPYELGDCELKNMLDSMIKNSIQTTENNGISTLSIFSSSLTGKGYTAKNGAKWTYQKGGNVSIDGQFIYLGITYNNAQQCATLSSALANTSQKKKIVQYVGAKLVGAALAKKLVSVVGGAKAIIIGEIFSFVYANYNPTDLQRQMLDKASNNKKGVMEIRYKTSYKGKWYATTTFEYWGGYPTAKTPGSAYGTGKFAFK